MKTKTFNKRLVLKKKTIAHLNNNEMKDLRAGGGKTSFTKCKMRTCEYKTCLC